MCVYVCVCVHVCVCLEVFGTTLQGLGLYTLVWLSGLESISMAFGFRLVWLSGLEAFGFRVWVRDHASGFRVQGWGLDISFRI